MPERAVYVNVGHISLAMPFFLRWLDARPDVTPVFMLHDVIPLDTPEYVSPSSVRHHATMVASTARHAAGLLVTTQTAQRTVRDALARIGRTDIMTLAQTPPLLTGLRHHGRARSCSRGRALFRDLRPIEPRKNHELLFNVWRGAHGELGAKAPHLVIIGSPGWKCDEILQPVRNNPQMCRHVHVASGLSSPALKRLLAGAIALLMPSHAEGFGLPLIEAMRLGVPVMASDIPAHREVVDAQALLLGPARIPWPGMPPSGTGPTAAARRCIRAPARTRWTSGRPISAASRTSSRLVPPSGEAARPGGSPPDGGGRRR